MYNHWPPSFCLLLGAHVLLLLRLLRVYEAREFPSKHIVTSVVTRYIYHGKFSSSFLLVLFK